MTGAESTWRANAKANLLQARQRHGARLGSKKSRNGCSTCRSRRVKCDELRPECQRCRDCGRVCKYESVLPPGGGKTVASPSNGLPLSQMFGVRDADRRTFDYFISYTAPRLAGAWDKEFWCHNILQVAQREPFIIDSVLAISILYEHPQYLASFSGNPGESPGPDNPGTSFEGTQVPDEHLARALKHYNRAIQRFTAEMHQGKASHPMALLSCVLFICIETIRDNVLAAMGLFTQGAKMLKQVNRSKTTSDEDGMLTLIEHIFQRMAVQSVLYGHPSGPSLRRDINANRKHETRTLAEARDSLFSHAIASHSFMREADAFRHAVIEAKLGESDQAVDGAEDDLYGLEMFVITRQPQSIFYTVADHDHYNKQMENRGAFKALRSFFNRLDPASNAETSSNLQGLISQKAELLMRLDQWKEDFRLLLKRLEKEQQAPAAVSYLQMYHFASLLWVSTRLETTESVFDSFTAAFRELLHHAEVYVRATAVQLPIFTFEIGAVLPLFLTASKCRVPSIRRQALDLMLQCPRKESTFGAHSCAQAICRLISIEEQGLGLSVPDMSGTTSSTAVDDSVLVPEDRRVHFFDVRKNRQERLYEMQVTRYRETKGRLERVVEVFAI